MPIYEYRCDSCKTVVEKRQNFSDALLTECETCGGRLEKLISAPSLQFKGTGWYVTDYAGKGNGSNGTPAASGDSGKSESTGESKSDAKSESKSDSKSEKKTGSDTTKSTTTATNTSKKG